jgi:hypothetical protein
MTVTLHRKVRAEVETVIDRYEAAGGRELADEFYAELFATIKQAAHSPGRFRIIERRHPES